ncbi:uncharacterized protein LOC127748762 [Frankliniella occidentalis]|uniref:Uncharacterized protein LOC127748762 n=1 Tax=Frankliniella occidentalis TaxID=133901 RepID=A0A9C6WX51_FRAOC|nr:uncharacterized protein LOC127748762 [Frankliniella occidentalis]
MKSAVPSLNIPTQDTLACLSTSTNESEVSVVDINAGILTTDGDCWEEMDVKQEVKFNPDAENMSQFHPQNSTVQDFPRPLGVPLLSCNSMTNDAFKYVTGLSKCCFEKFLNILTVSPFTLPACDLSAGNQLFLTLCKMKCNFSFDHLSVVLKVEPNAAFIVFSFWTYTIFRVMKSMCHVSKIREGKLLGSISIGLVQVNVLKHYTSCIDYMSSFPQVSTSLKGIVAVDDSEIRLYYCSKLYDECVSADVMLQNSGLKKSLGATSFLASESLLLSNYFKNCTAKVTPIVSDCVCGKDAMTRYQASKFAMSRKCFQCLVEMYRILADGIPTNLTIMQSEIFFSCMMMLNLREDLFMSD